MASFNYGANRVNGVDTSCRCDEIIIIPDLIFSVNITQCIITGCVFSECVFVFRGEFWTPFIRRGKVLSFLTITLVGSGKPGAITD